MCELELLQDGIMCSVSIIGSGEEGADPGEDGSTINRRFFILLISSLTFIAICSGVRLDSLKQLLGLGGSPSLIFFSGVAQCIGIHLLRLLVRLGEYRGSKSGRLRLSVTHAILLDLSRGYLKLNLTLVSSFNEKRCKFNA